VIGRIEQPRIAAFSGEQDERANRHDPLVVLGGAAEGNGLRWEDDRTRLPDLPARSENPCSRARAG
jgi:hypothetical protein